MLLKVKFFTPPDGGFPVFSTALFRHLFSDDGLFSHQQRAGISPPGDLLFEEEANEIIHTVTLSKELLNNYQKEFPAWVDADKELLRY